LLKAPSRSIMERLGVDILAAVISVIVAMMTVMMPVTSCRCHYADRQQSKDRNGLHASSFLEVRERR
jgi:hypothetical protein